MRALAAVMVSALGAWFSLAAPGAGESPRQLASVLAEQRALIVERPSDAGVWNDLGNLLSLAGDLDAAEAAYMQALQLDPARAATRFNLALLREQRGDVAGATADYRALLEADPRHARAHYQLGAILERQGQRDDALARYAEAFTLDPELLFAEMNPHVIENRLVTEALLLARRGSRSKPATPRAYAEPGRITSLLEPAPQAAPETAEEWVEESPVETPVEESSEAAPDSVRLRPAFGEPSPARAPEPAEVGGESDRSSTGTTAGVARDRVLDSSDLRRSGVANQIQDGAAGDAMPVGPGGRRRAAAEVNSPGGSRRQSLHQAPEVDPKAFGFGERSTGALEWRLGPATDQPVPAR